MKNRAAGRDVGPRAWLVISNVLSTALRPWLFNAGPAGLVSPYLTFFPRPYGHGYLMSALRAWLVISNVLSTALRPWPFNTGPAGLVDRVPLCAAPKPLGLTAMCVAKGAGA